MIFNFDFIYKGGPDSSSGKVLGYELDGPDSILHNSEKSWINGFYTESKIPKKIDEIKEKRLELLRE